MAGILATENNQSQIEDINKAKDLLHKDGKKVEAIDLLVAVSKTGNKDATAMLTQCLDNGEGITNENRDIVEWCVKTPEVDKRLNHAMTELFMSLKKDGRENVTVQDIKDALNIAKEQIKESSSSSEPKESSNQEEVGLMSVLKSAMSVGGKDELTLGEFMDTAMSYAKGEVPEMVMVLDKNEFDDYNKASHLEKDLEYHLPPLPLGPRIPFATPPSRTSVLKYPHQSLESFKFSALSIISRRGSTWLKSLVPTSQIQTLVLLYLYHQLSAKILWFIVPLMIFYISMTTLIVFSLQMFHGRQSLRKLRNFSNILRKFDPLINDKETETKFMWNSITPYVWFFLFILITVAVYPLCDKDWIPCSELSLIALFFAGKISSYMMYSIPDMTDVSAYKGLPDEYDDFTMYTIGLKVLTMVLYSFSDVKGLWVLCHPFLIIPLPYKLEFHISVPGILHIVILVMLVIMAGRHSWTGIYKILIPHIVCLLWWQLFTELFVHTTWYSLIRASIGWVIFITLLPLLVVYVIGVFLANFLQWFLVLDLAMKLAVTAIAIGVSSVLVLYSNIKIPQDVRKRRTYVLAVVAVVVFCLLGPMFYVNYVPPEKGAAKVKLPWERYDALCGPKARSLSTEAALQATCAEFVGETVMWKGRVMSVQVASIDNRFRALVTAMPIALRPTLRCLLGGEEEEEPQRYNNHYKVLK
ncbi:hypothetical protein QZH41_012567, partial [Actinostola sp. cb2023]